ncbi:DUF3311 domain-containing protein [Streptomyces meridianus]|uniref:DUF3311 domain-containing protein n=1 Tax=Streptomyces meridianus TaxID=2938945 RepID=A0ABT0X0R7_9ACTN|nr:DUF3311 domain-containing protein [Streptomyces meridianus]MCM2576113.1 DUF3311 domain-containing protein [Streptomyces meridianus]
MPQPARSPDSLPVVTPARVIAGVCLILPFLAMLWVGSYSRIEPTLIGMPFFYWYQMVWVLVSTGLTMLAYTLIRRDRRARRGGEQ